MCYVTLSCSLIAGVASEWRMETQDASEVLFISLKRFKKVVSRENEESDDDPFKTLQK